MSGFAPYPVGFSDTRFDYYGWGAEGIATAYKRHGFTSSFTSSWIPSEETKNFFIRMGFDDINTPENISALQYGPRFALNAVADDILYKEVIRQVRNSIEHDTSLLSIVSTSTSHVPYLNPKTGSRDEIGTWEYIGESLQSLHAELTSSDFFKDGILIITGDHRKYAPVTQEEVDKMGFTARCRIPLCLIGQNVTPGSVDDRAIDLSNIFRLLPASIEGAVYPRVIPPFFKQIYSIEELNYPLDGWFVNPLHPKKALANFSLQNGKMLFRPIKNKLGQPYENWISSEIRENQKLLKIVPLRDGIIGRK